MSTLKALLKDVPVEWKALGELAILKRGRVMSKNYLIENIGSYPVYSSQTANDGKIGEIKTFDFEGEFLTWTTDGANAGTIFYRQGKFSITNVCGLVEIKAPTSLSYKFLYYWLNIESKKHVYAGMGNPKLMSHQMEKIQIPIPYPNDPEKSLAVQQEIVRVLDGLSEQNKALTTALAQEIDQRKKQYAYYREELFRFEGKEVEWKTLGEVLNSTKGTKITAGQMKELDKVGGNIKIFAGGKTVAFFNKEDLPAKDINTLPSIIVKSRGIIEFEYYDKPFSHKNEMWSYNTANNLIKIKYVYHFLKIKEPYFQNLGSRMQMPQISIPDTDKFKIPIIPVQEQERIVRLLDQFDEATKNIVAQLEREIELRNKQYEYYRNELLGFNG